MTNLRAIDPDKDAPREVKCPMCDSRIDPQEGAKGHTADSCRVRVVQQRNQARATVKELRAQLYALAESLHASHDIVNRLPPRPKESGD